MTNKPLAKRLLGWGKELLILVVGFLLLSTIVGRLRAPDLPEVAPDFTLADIAGAEVSLKDYRGKTVILNFWATWCTPCRAEIPMLSQFARSHPDVPVLGIAVDGSVDQLRTAKEDWGMDYPILRAAGGVVETYGASTVPTTVVVGPDGKIEFSHVGIITTPQLWWAAF